jgi:hypothetical protein
VFFVVHVFNLDIEVHLRLFFLYPASFFFSFVSFVVFGFFVFNLGFPSPARLNVFAYLTQGALRG